MRTPKFLTEPINLKRLADLIEPTIIQLTRPRTLNQQQVMNVLTRPIPLKILLVIPIGLWLMWVQVSEFLVKHFRVITRYNSISLDFIVTMISTASILVLLAPLVSANKLTTELGLHRPSNTDTLE